MRHKVLPAAEQHVEGSVEGDHVHIVQLSGAHLRPAALLITVGLGPGNK